jgi:ABC-type lipoprotein export system ATPase subunit
MNKLLQAENLHKTFGQVTAIRDVSLNLGSNDFMAIIGKSGSGKTTTMHLLAGLESPDSGRILFDGQDISALSEDALALWRREHIGLVFQAFHLIPTLSALENVAFPLYPTDFSAKERRGMAAVRLEQVGMGHRLKHRPGQLSGGEQQRVAIARALINSPNLIMADEPTGNLDSETGTEVIHLLKKLNHEENVAIIIITHDLDVAGEADRVVRVRDGEIVDEK